MKYNYFFQKKHFSSIILLFLFCFPLLNLSFKENISKEIIINGEIINRRIINRLSNNIFKNNAEPTKDNNIITLSPNAQYDRYIKNLMKSKGKIFNTASPNNIHSINGARSSPKSSGSRLAYRENVIDEILISNSKDALYSLPNQGFFNDSNHHIFWFIQITDTQMMWMEWGTHIRRGPNDGRVKAINYFLNTTQKVIAPLFIMNTGDLVDSEYDNYFEINDGQLFEEWDYYNETMRKWGMNSSNYFDIVGNHDVYDSPGFEHYLNYSISGSAFGTDQFMVKYEFDWGNYTFYYLSTPEQYGVEFPFELGGHMTRAELGWLENKLIHNQDATVSIAAGHHPVREIFSELSPQDKKTFVPLMREYGVDAYFCGHGHENVYEEHQGLAAIETSKLEDGESGYRIIAIDEDKVSTSFQPKDKWPVGIITSPLDIKHTIGDYNKTTHENPDKIHVLAWDPNGIESVEWQSDNSGDWIQMNKVKDGEPLYESEFNNSLIDSNAHKIKVKITNTLGDVSYEEIIYKSKDVKHVAWYDFMDLYIIVVIALAIIIPISVHQYRKKNPEKATKEPKSQIIPEQKHYLLLKLAALFFLPLGVGLFYDHSLTLVFGFFIILKYGFMYSDVPILFSLIILLIGILPLSYKLSPKYQRWIKWNLFWSILIDIFFLTFYLVRYTYIAWISGLWILLYSDIKMFKIARQYPKEKRKKKIEKKKEPK